MLDQPYPEGLHEFMPGKQIFIIRRVFLDPESSTRSVLHDYAGVPQEIFVTVVEAHVSARRVAGNEITMY
jgi:hypothetical protein